MNDSLSMAQGADWKTPAAYEGPLSALPPSEAPAGIETPLVLVVEDNRDMNSLLSQILTEKFKVESAFDGREGLEKAIQLQPSLIVSDVMMPLMSGEEFVQEVRGRRELDNIPILILSVKAEESLRVKLLKEGVQDYLIKPFSPEEFLARSAGLIAQRQRAEASLRESYALLRAITERISEGVYVKDRRGRYQMINSAAARLLGKPLDEILGRDDLHLFSPDVARAIGAVDRWVIAEGKSKTFEEVRHLDGVNRTYLTTKGPYLDQQGRLVGVIGISRDITERKQTEEALRQSEERLRIALQAARMGVWEKDLLTQATTWSPELEPLMGLPPSSPAEGYAAFLAWIHPQDRPRIDRALNQVIVQRLDCNLEFRFLDRQGTVRWATIIGQLHRDSFGEAKKLVGVAMDVTERKRADEERRYLLRQLVTAQEEERRGLSRELHDQMGQHLTALQLGLKSLKDSLPLDAAGRTRVEQLQELADQMGCEVHNLALALRPTSLDDLGLHTTLANFIQEWSERSHIEVDFHSTGLEDRRLSPELETIVYRVVQESLTNVVKHAEATRLSLIMERREGCLQAIVEDNGKGFEAERVMSSPTAEGRLGLIGMKERLALVGGTLQLESGPGAGTTVFIRIPLPEE